MRGYSLVEQEKLLEGGKSQSRNPLIARALRTIKFAEISGSGIRAISRACQQANRKAPRFSSDRAANTFTMTLDWSEGTQSTDEYWRTLLGVHLTAQQALILNALVELPSATFNVLIDHTSMEVEEVENAIEFLLLQQLVEQDESNYQLADHVRGKIG